MRANEKGLTLTEILAGLVLLSIVTILTTIILMNIFDSDKTEAKSASIKQDTNTMISQLRDEFYNGKDDKICFDDQAGRLIIDKETSVLDGKASIDWDGDQICLTDFDRKYPIKLQVVTKDKAENADNKVRVETTLVKGHQLALGDYDDGLEPCEVPVINPKETRSSLPCSFEGDLAWNGTEVDACDDGEQNFIDGNLLITDEVNGKVKGVDIKVTGNLLASNEVHLEGADWDIGGSAVFEKQPYFEKENNINIGKSACFDGRFKIFGNSHVNILGSATVRHGKDGSGESDLKDGSLQIKGNLVSGRKQFRVFENATLKVDGNADFQGALIEKSTASMYVGGDLTSHKNDFQLANGVLKVDGNATLNKFDRGDSAKFCLGKQLTVKNGDEDIKIDNICPPSNIPKKE